MFQFAALAIIVPLVIKELIMSYKVFIAYSNYQLQITDSEMLLIAEVRDK